MKIPIFPQFLRKVRIFPLVGYGFFFSLARSPQFGSRPRLKMAMHALAEGYLIKGDFGQAEGWDKFRFFFPFLFLVENNGWIKQTWAFFEKKSENPPCICIFCDLLFFFSLETCKKPIKKQLKVGYISFIPNLVWISQLVLKFFHCTPREGLAATPWSSPKPTLPPVDDGHWQAMDAAEEAQQKEGDDQILEAPEIWEGLVQQGSNWWFHIFFMSTPTWGNDSIWRIFFR